MSIDDLIKKMITEENVLDAALSGKLRHPGMCKGEYDAMNGDFDCGYGVTFSCEDCRFGPLSLIDGRKGKDPRAKCNRPT
jgi:hypothetical protein